MPQLRCTWLTGSRHCGLGGYLKEELQWPDKLPELLTDIALSLRCLT